MSQTYTKPRPKADPLMAPFWENAAKGKLMIQQCDACGDRHFPPSPVCPKCLSGDQSWMEAAGRGTLQTWIELHRAYWPGFEADLPYQVCIVELEEGPLMVSNFTGPTDEAAVGARVEVSFDRVADDLTLPRFRLAESGESD